MPAADLQRALAGERRRIEARLRRLLAAERGTPPRLAAAMRHSLLGGGKRLRPILALWTWDAVAPGRGRRRQDREAALGAAAALEMLHTYSLIHDDLPAMDDDVLRRGLPTCHVAFDEATAILAGDALQALAFATLAGCGGPLAAELVALVATAVGPVGMVGGQQDDLDAEGAAEVTARAVSRIHRRKTGCLLAAAMQTGALLGGAEAAVVAELGRAGLDLGLAFQGADDLLDVTADPALLGKSVGKDAAAGKATWVRIEGLERAAARTRRLGRSGLRRLEAVLPEGPGRARLVALGGLMWDRER